MEIVDLNGRKGLVVGCQRAQPCLVGSKAFRKCRRGRFWSGRYDTWALRASPQRCERGADCWRVCLRWLADGMVAPKVILSARKLLLRSSGHPPREPAKLSCQK